MERHLKERLVGAAVLLAVGNILISEMLSGPPDSKDGATAVTADGSPVKTYTIDLRRREQLTDPSSAAMPPPELPTPEPSVAERRPQPSESETIAPMSEPGIAQAIKPERDEDSSVARQPDRLPAAELPAAKPVTKPDVKPNIEPDSKPERLGGAWAVQVASLDNRSAAEKIAGELKSDGFGAFVMPVEVNGKTKFRVRVGPVPTRPAADALLTKVKRAHAGATVMRHP